MQPHVPGPDASFSGPPAVVETHSAWVVFLGDRAYKIKKPVKLDFLDFSSLAARGRALHAELALNRRLAPDVYLGVSVLLGPDHEVAEHVLVMRRMPGDRRLSELVVRAEPVAEAIRAIARLLVDFHAKADTSPGIAAAGSPATVRSKVEQDLDELDVFAPEILVRDDLDEARRLTLEYLRGRTTLLDDRVARGCIRDGHGDLLADDIFCLPDGPRILDCIEFDAGLRRGDVLADVAFLVMDLERLGAPELGDRLLAWYSEFAGERHPDSLADYYVAARALIRAKVACIRAVQGDAASPSVARDLLQLALEHLRRAQVRLVLVGGSPGTGKSTVARDLTDRFGWVLLRSDEVRKDVTRVGRGVARHEGVDRGVYTVGTTDATYAELLLRAGRALRAGETVVLDATWTDAAMRAAAHRLAVDASAALVELQCVLPGDMADARASSVGSVRGPTRRTLTPPSQPCSASASTRGRPRSRSPPQGRGPKWRQRPRRSCTATAVPTDHPSSNGPAG